MMNQDLRALGTLSVMLERFSEYRLPRARRMLARVQRGERLTDEDIGFLMRVYRDGEYVQPLVERHPEYRRVIAAALGLYTEIIETGLANEARQEPASRASSG